MARISYLNDQFLPHEECFVHIEDRAVQFGDGVYEVILYKNNKFVDFEGHFNRLLRSLNEIKIDFSLSQDRLKDILVTLFKKNNLDNGSCYIQISRGQAPRVQWFPAGIKPTINITVSPAKVVAQEDFLAGISVMTHEDLRWGRCDIKSLNLLPAALLNQKAKDLGFSDVIMIRDGFVTEGSFSNAFMIDQHNSLITRPADNFILCGITRNRIIKLAANLGLKVEERKFTLEELESAKEVFLSSSTLMIRAVTQVNEQEISKEAGEITIDLLRAYKEFALA